MSAYGIFALRRARKVATSAILALFLFHGAHVANAGPLAVIEGQTLDVRADKLDIDINKGSAVLEGHVIAGLGDLTVDCSKIEVRYDEAPKVRWARGSGGVTAKLKGIEAQAASVELDVASRTVKLSGNVRLSRGRGWVTADTAAIDMTTRKVTLEDVKGSIPVQAPAR